MKTLIALCWLCMFRRNHSLLIETRVATQKPPKSPDGCVIQAREDIRNWFCQCRLPTLKGSFDPCRKLCNVKQTFYSYNLLLICLCSAWNDTCHSLSWPSAFLDRINSLCGHSYGGLCSLCVPLRAFFRAEQHIVYCAALLKVLIKRTYMKFSGLECHHWPYLLSVDIVAGILGGRGGPGPNRRQVLTSLGLA